MSGPAQLYRSTAHFQEEVDHRASELIGDGDLAKMVRLALSDPEGELWRYSVTHAGKTYVGGAIQRLATP